MPLVLNKPVTGDLIGFTANGKDYWSDLIEVQFKPKKASKDLKTFGQVFLGVASDMGTGDLTLKAQSSTAADALWRFLWTNVGKKIDFIFAMHGNKTATADKPHIKGSFTIDEEPELAVKAGKGEEMDFSVTYPMKFQRELLIASSTLGTGNAESIV